MIVLWLGIVIGTVLGFGLAAIRGAGKLADLEHDYSVTLAERDEWERIAHRQVERMTAVRGRRIDDGARLLGEIGDALRGSAAGGDER